MTTESFFFLIVNYWPFMIVALGLGVAVGWMNVTSAE
jgi:hypothetical protein